MAQAEQDSLPATVDQMAAAVLAVFAAAEARLVTGSATLVQAAIVNPALVSGLRGRLDRLALSTAQEVQAKVGALANQVAATAARNGDAAAAREIRVLEQSVKDWTASPVSRILPHNVTASRFIAEDLNSRLTAAAHRITRFSDDAYRAATTGGALTQVNPARDIVNDVLTRATPAEAQAQAWRELSAKGVTGFTDSAGREWNLATYVEMATRTATQRAYNASHRERLTLAGITLFTPSTTGRPCPLCAPWEGMVLSDSGAGAVEVDGHAVTVAATIEEATAAGLFHPNCKHTLLAYLPGFTQLVPNQWTEQDEAAYKDTQKLRALERAVRQARQVQAAALTPADRAAAGRDVRAAQANVRAFVNESGLNRRTRREQLNLGNK